MPRPDQFNETVESFHNYKERLDCFFVAHDTPTAKQSAVLLSSIGPKVYGTLRSLTAPDLPSSKTYGELCKALEDHFNPRPLEIVERYKFHLRQQQQSESISEFIAAIKKLSEHCNFGDTLLVSLRDRFVCGLKDVMIQKRLLLEADLTFDRATNIALAMETAQHDAVELQGHASAPSTSALNAIGARSTKNKTKQQTSTVSFPPCPSCGKTNHRRSDCFHKDSICKHCFKRGHIQLVCRSPIQPKQGNSNLRSASATWKPFKQTRSRPKVHEIEAETDVEQFTLDMYNIGSGDASRKIMLDVTIDTIPTKMELDTGSAISIMTIMDYKNIFQKEPTLLPTPVNLRTYTGEIIRPLGTTQVNVDIDNQQKLLQLYILKKGSNPIFGREWLREIKLNWPEIKKIESTQYTATALQEQFKAVFQDGIGKIKNMEATLHVKDGSAPKFMKARPVPFAIKPKVEKALDDLEKQGIISKVSHSDWATPIVPVIKKSGDIRICGDFKVTINPVLEVEQYTLPRLDDMMASLEQGKKFSKIDLRQAYFQLPLSEESKRLTTINTTKGLYVFNRLVFGITSSPAIWQKTIDQIVQGLPGILVNQDDMIISGKSEEDHHKNLCMVLQRLQDSGIKANLSKCSFYQDEVIFCGIKVSNKGLHKTEDKIKAIQDAPTPKNKSQLRSFLGLANYYHKWLPNSAHICKPLYDLLQNDAPFVWSNRCQTAFQTIKSMIASDLVLNHYDPSLPLKLATDASPYGLGAVISHVTDEGEKPISFASRTLSKAEQKYSQLDKEALAIVWAVKKFFFYLCGRHFTLVTDHQPLKYIFSPDKGIPAMSAARQQRYAVFLSGFDYSIEYRNSEANANADSLSRLPLQDQGEITEEDTDDLFYKEILETTPISASMIATESRHDPVLSKVIHYVSNDNWPNQVLHELRPFQIIRHELSIHQNCLLWGHRVIPPSKFRNSILESLHSGHLGMMKMKNLARNYFWWPGMDKDIETTAKSCNGCAMSQPDPLLSPLHPWQWPSKPWQRIHIDYAGPFLGQMFLIAIDAHSKWAEIIPASCTTSTTTINILSTMFSRYGIPEHLVSDNGPQFVSDEFKCFTRGNGIRHIRSSPYHPATNGLAERMVQSFKSAMKSAMQDKGNVHTKLARFLLAYRNAPHATTGETPASLMFGRKLRTKLDLALPNIKERILNSQNDQVMSHSQAKLRIFDIGDKVLARDYRGHQRWQPGIIHSNTGSRTYEVEIAPGTLWHRHSDQIVHNSANIKPAAPGVSLPPTIYRMPEPTSPAPESPQLDQFPPQIMLYPKINRANAAKETTTWQTRPSLSVSDQDAHERAPVRGENVSPQEHHKNNTPYKTRSGRSVRKPDKYTS